jgi:hypothetical protein
LQTPDRALRVALREGRIAYLPVWDLHGPTAVINVSEDEEGDEAMRTARRDHGTVTATRHGKQYTGDWIITGQLITVSHSQLGAKSTQIGGSRMAPESLAQIMLGELISENEPRPDPKAR